MIGGYCSPHDHDHWPRRMNRCSVCDDLVMGCPACQSRPGPDRRDTAAMIVGGLVIGLVWLVLLAAWFSIPVPLIGK